LAPSAISRIRCRSRRAGRDGRRPSQKLPPTAIYCHFGAAKPLHLFQPLHSFGGNGRAVRALLSRQQRTRGARSLAWHDAPSAVTEYSAKAIAAGTDQPSRRCHATLAGTAVQVLRIRVSFASGKHPEFTQCEYDDFIGDIRAAKICARKTTGRR
jgi:hypothetical protein